MDEPSLPVETFLQHDGVDVRVEPGEFPRRSVGDDGGALDLSPGSGGVEGLDDPVDQARDLAVQLPVVTEEDAEDLGKVGAVARPRGEEHLPVRKHKQELLVHVLTEEQRALLRAGRAEAVRLPALGVEHFAAERAKVLGITAVI